MKVVGNMHRVCVKGLWVQCKFLRAQWTLATAGALSPLLAHSCTISSDPESQVGYQMKLFHHSFMLFNICKGQEVVLIPHFLFPNFTWSSRRCFWPNKWFSGKGWERDISNVGLLNIHFYLFDICFLTNWSPHSHCCHLCGKHGFPIMFCYVILHPFLFLHISKCLWPCFHTCTIPIMSLWLSFVQCLRGKCGWRLKLD